MAKQDEAEKKATYYLAKALALSNAAEFIRGHGEEGFSFEDEQLEAQYKKAGEVLGKQLDNRSATYFAKYISLGIIISTNVDDNY